MKVFTEDKNFNATNAQSTKQQKTNKQKTIYSAVTRLYMELDSIEKCFHRRNVSVGFSMSHMFI